MDLLGEPVTKIHAKRTAARIWSLEDDCTSKSDERLVKDANDVTFVDPENLLVADSSGHGLFLVKAEACEGQTAVSDADDSGKKGTSIRENIADDSLEANQEYRGRKYARILTDEIWPNCLVVTRDLKIRLTDRKTKTIRTYDLRGDLLSVWKAEEGQLGRPHGIGLLSTGETVVSDVSMHCVHVFSDSGKILRSFGSRGDLLHHFRLPFYLTVDSEDHIMVSDNMNFCVKIFDASGNFINRIGSGNLFGHRQFQSPYGITFDSSYNEILVADHESNKIFAYGKDGEFVRYYVSGSECESPCGISVHSDCGLLALTTSNPDASNVQLYRIITK